MVVIYKKGCVAAASGDCAACGSHAEMESPDLQCALLLVPNHATMILVDHPGGQHNCLLSGSDRGSLHRHLAVERC